MSERTQSGLRVVSTWYRCLLEDGTLWAESSSRGEVLVQGQFAEGPVVYEEMAVVQYNQPWRPFRPSVDALAEAGKTAAAMQADEDDDE